MVARREVVGGSLLAGLTAMVMPASGSAAQDRQREGNTEEIVKALDRLRQTLEQQGGACELGPCATIAAIRNQQKTFIRANRKYPDFIDAGIDAWEAVYDWHVKNRQELRLSRLADGRYGLMFMFTTIVLREDQVPGFVGWGYDAR